VSTLFSGPPKPQPLPKMPQPGNKQLDAAGQQAADRQGAAASVFTTNKGAGGATVFGS
jgi:hypothetical protein